MYPFARLLALIAHIELESQVTVNREPVGGIQLPHKRHALLAGLAPRPEIGQMTRKASDPVARVASPPRILHDVGHATCHAGSELPFLEQCYSSALEAGASS